MKTIFLPEAELELSEGIEFYNQQLSALGVSFLEEVRHAISFIKSYHAIGMIVESQIRKVLVRRFPYSIIYRVDPDEIVIIAVMHLKRKPRYWTKRLKD